MKKVIILRKAHVTMKSFVLPFSIRGETFRSLLVTFCSLLGYFLLVARYFLLLTCDLLLVAQQETLKDVFLVKVNKKLKTFAILMGTKDKITRKISI